VIDRIIRRAGVIRGSDHPAPSYLEPSFPYFPGKSIIRRKIRLKVTWHVTISPSCIKV
jgi:hypothetical protein